MKQEGTMKGSDVKSDIIYLTYNTTEKDFVDKLLIRTGTLKNT